MKLAQISRDESLKQLAHRRQAIELQVQNLDAAFKEWDAKAIEASRKMADYASCQTKRWFRTGLSSSWD